MRYCFETQVHPSWFERLNLGEAFRSAFTAAIFVFLFQKFLNSEIRGAVVELGSNIGFDRMGRVSVDIAPKMSLLQGK